MLLITPGLLTALGIFILIMKLKHDTLRKLLGFDIFLDTFVTIILMVAFAGTFSGMMAAIVGGIGFSLALGATKKIYGYKKLTVIHTPDHFWPSLQWVVISGLTKTSNRTDTAAAQERATQDLINELTKEA